jgi:hypothetical protein
MNKLKHILIGSTAAIFAGCVFAPLHRHEVIITPTVVNEPPTFSPPNPIAEVVPPKPYPNAVWVSGYWDYNDQLFEYFWVPGAWVIDPPAGQFAHPHWEYRNGHYIYIPGRWRQ